MLYSWHLFLKKNTAVDSQYIKVYDLGAIHGNDLDPKSRKLILNTVIGDSPFQETLWDADHVRTSLENVSLYPESIRGNELKITPEFKSYGAAEIEKLILSKYQETDNSDFKVVLRESPQIPEFLKFKLVIDKSPNAGIKNAEVHYATFDNKQERIPFAYTLLKKISTVTALQDIKKGERLVRECISKNEQWIDHEATDVFTEFPSGYVALKNIDKGTTIFREDVRLKPEVNYGDKIVIRYTDKNLLIESEVRALQSGSSGSIIKFRTHKNKIIYGKLSSGTDAVFTMGKN
ncbi:MAG: flagella basal body P-ring formation protein FlgA [Spirochaetia bacterium]|nr:flagella basal body P-ring formation protein FlgA [Spirochaetia bacterium]